MPTKKPNPKISSNPEAAAALEKAIASGASRKEALEAIKSFGYTTLSAATYTKWKKGHKSDGAKPAAVAKQPTKKFKSAPEVGWLDLGTGTFHSDYSECEMGAAIAKYELKGTAKVTKAVEFDQKETAVQAIAATADQYLTEVSSEPAEPTQPATKSKKKSH